MASSTQPSKDNACHLPLIQRVPPEVLSHIFSFFTLEWKKHGLLPPALLGGVSRYWRFVATSTRCLWTSIYIRIDKKHPHVNSDAVSTWLERSGSLPLDITVIREFGHQPSWDANEASSLLIPHCHRWCYLHLSINWDDAQTMLDASARSGGLPILDELVLNCQSPFPPEDDDNDEPCYTTLSLSLCPKLTKAALQLTAGLSVSGNDPPYSLEEVTGLYEIPLDVCFELIRKSPALRILRGSCDISAFRKFPSVFTHNSITELDLSQLPQEDDVADFLESLKLPSLKSLNLEIPYYAGVFSDAVVDFLRRSSPPLKQLGVSARSSAHLLAYLRHTPQLHTIHDTLNATNNVLDALICQYAPSDPRAATDIVPKLDNIQLRCKPGVNAKLLNDVVLSRWGGPSARFPGKGRLRSIYFECEQDMLTPELKRCIEEGLKVDSTWMRVGRSGAVMSARRPGI